MDFHFGFMSTCLLVLANVLTVNAASSIRVASGQRLSYLSSKPNGRVYLKEHLDDHSGRQQWIFRHLFDDIYNIIVSGGTDVGENYLSCRADGFVDLWTHDGGDRQKWRLQKIGNNVYNIKVYGGTNPGEKFLSCTEDGFVDLYSHEGIRQRWILSLVSGCEEVNVNFGGNDIPGGLSKQQNWQSCQSSCKINPKCTHWTFRNEDGNCWFKTGNNVQSNEDGLVSGPQDCSGKELILYEHNMGSGRQVSIFGAKLGFRAFNFNDIVSNVEAIKGDWELYTHDGYWGNRMVVKEGQGVVNALHNDQYSSARPICQYEDDPSTAKLKIYEHKSLQGDHTEFLNEVKNVHEAGNWGDKVVFSVHAIKGDWELYTQPNYWGFRLIVKEGDNMNVDFPYYPFLHQLHADYQWSSLRPICKTYSPKCKPVDIEILANANSLLKFKGTQIIGAVSGFSCNDPSTKVLTLNSVNSVTKSTSLSTSTSEGINWSVGASLSIKGKVGFLGSGTEVTATISAATGGSSTVTQSKTETFTSGMNKLVGSSTTFSTPGAALAFGTVDIYEIDNSDVPVKIHLECPGGKKEERMSTMQLTAHTFQSAHFWDFVKSVDAEDCNKVGYITKVDKCIKNVKARYLRKFGEIEKIRKVFNDCFAI